MSSNPSIVYVTPCSPDGLDFGTRLRVRQVARALRELGELKIVVVGGAEDFPTQQNGTGEFEIERFLPLHHLTPNNLSARYRRLLDVRSNPYGRHLDSQSQDWVQSYVKNFDLVWVHHLRTAYAVGQWKWKRSVMDLDDVTSMHCRSVAANSERVMERVKSKVQIQLTRRRERLLSDRFTVVSVCSEADREYLNLPGPVHVIPNGFDAPAQEPQHNPIIPPRFGFIGTFNYQPNVDSVHWFVCKCWPRIKREIPNAQLRLAGDNSYNALKIDGADIEVLGYVESPAAEMDTWSAMIVPTRKGAGTRVKIADGFSKKVPMITTSLGVCGYDVKSGVELYIADHADEFAQACILAIKDPESSRRMAEQGWRRFSQEWSWDAIRPKIWAAAEDCLRRDSRPAAAAFE